MARISIALPERFVFFTEFPLHASHINMGGHLDSVQLLLLVAEARTRFFLEPGARPLREDDARIVMADTALQYCSEAFYGEVMRVRMGPRDVQRCGFDLVFEMSDRASGRLVARGKLGIVFVDAATGRAREIPASWADRLRSEALTAESV